MKFKFKVTQTDVYIQEIEINANSLSEAEGILDKQLDNEPIDQSKNALESSDVERELISTDGKKFNHMMTVAFEVVSGNPQGASNEEIISAVEKRISKLKASDEIQEAVGPPNDTFEIEEETKPWDLRK